MENNKFKIALFMLPLLSQGGGAEKYFIELARNLRERNIEVDIITMDERFFQKFARLLHIFALGKFFGKIDTSGREKETDISHKLGKAHWIKTDFKNLAKMLRSYDLVYSKNELVDLALLRLKGYKNIPPIIVGVHTPIFYPETKSFIAKLHNFIYLGFFYRWLLKGTKCVHVCNKFTKDLLKDKLCVESKLVYYPFSARLFADLAKNNISSIDFPADKINIMFSGRLGEQKGVEVLFHIIERLGKDKILNGKVRLNILGSGDKRCEDRFKRSAQKYSFVSYFGHVEHKYMPHILSRQKFMVAPSRWETLPYAILEAQAMGLPVVAFDIPGPNDIIENGKTGFLARSEEDFFEKIESIIGGKINFERDAIIRNFETKFHPDKIYSELIKMFEEIL